MASAKLGAAQNNCNPLEIFVNNCIIILYGFGIPPARLIVRELVNRGGRTHVA